MVYYFTEKEILRDTSTLHCETQSTWAILLQVVDGEDGKW